MKRIYKLLPLLLILALLAACGAAPAETAGEDTFVPTEKDRSGAYFLSETGEAILDDEAFSAAVGSADNFRVFYEIFVGSFSDSDGDGTGDLRGVIDRMDYLNDGDPASGLSLGIEGIWLSPVFVSPSYHKYDVTDYYTVDPEFGTNDDLRELAELCHERGIKLILDLPINHTGSQNQWFKFFQTAHRSGNTSDPWYDFYSWCSADEPVPAGRTFRELPGTGELYECNFSGDMPELNFDNDDVRSAVLDVAEYWLDLGVDGFRFDAAKYVYFGDHSASADFWTWYLDELRALSPEIYTVAEVWDADGVTDLYYPALNCFDFTTSQTSGLIAATAQKGNVNAYTSYVDGYLDRVQKLRPDAMIVPFIANHDTDRAAGYLTVASGAMQMAANLYILSSGSPFIYYGEEIGLRGSRGGANTDANRRLAMRWGDGDTVRDPEGATYEEKNQVKDTVADQLADGDSLLSYYKKLLMIRKANPEIARGDYTALPFTGTKLGGFTAEWEGTTVAVIHNTTLSSITVDLSEVTDVPFDTLAAVIGQEDASLDGTVLTLGSMTSAVLR